MDNIDLDLKGLLCPMPILRLQEFMDSIDQREVVLVRCSDMGALVDIPRWCKMRGHQVLFVEKKETEYFFQIQKINKIIAP